MRVLDSEAIALDVNTLGFNETQKTDYLRAIQNSQGIILVTDPTGSGKTECYENFKYLG